ncbi:MAG TPA: fluoride efflux transporter CrcB [Armatimonadota bacterium]|jgi:CrcB protein
MGPLAKTIWVGLGGFLGANARYWLGGWVAQRYGTQFPWGTLVINVSGSFVLGLIMALGTDRFSLPLQARLLLPIGFVGAYTTFSTFEYETLSLAQDASLLLALGNVAGSVTLGFLGVWLGVQAAKLL